MADAASASQATRVLYTGGYLCVEWTVGAAMGCMVGGPALLAIAQVQGYRGLDDFQRCRTTRR